jgi:AraC-like DNA-binding protein
MMVFTHYGLALSLFAILLICGKRTGQLADKILVLFLLSLALPMMADLFLYQSRGMANRSKAILTLVYEVGFNSRTTFNTFFKKSTGKTPTEFSERFSETE